jgi:hypothetical protein
MVLGIPGGLAASLALLAAPNVMFAVFIAMAVYPNAGDQDTLTASPRHLQRHM